MLSLERLRSGYFDISGNYVAYRDLDAAKDGWLDALDDMVGMGVLRVLRVSMRHIVSRQFMCALLQFAVLQSSTSAGHVCISMTWWEWIQRVSVGGANW